MSKLSDALGAMDKATPWPWWGDDEAPDFIWAKRDGETFHVVDAQGCDELSAICHIIAAAPDMAAWIKKALPYMKFARACVGAGLISTNKAYDEKELDALIKEATE